MEFDVKALVGLIISAVAVIGGVVMRDRWMSKSIREGDDKIHERINDVKRDYVRRDDLDNHLTRMSAEMKAMHMEQKAEAKGLNDRIDSVNSRLDSILAAVTVSRREKD